jgi:hypothetical protein
MLVNCIGIIGDNARLFGLGVLLRLLRDLPPLEQFIQADRIGLRLGQAGLREFFPDLGELHLRTVLVHRLHAGLKLGWDFDHDAGVVGRHRRAGGLSGPGRTGREDCRFGIRTRQLIAERRRHVGGGNPKAASGALAREHAEGSIVTGSPVTARSRTGISDDGVSDRRRPRG